MHVCVYIHLSLHICNIHMRVCVFMCVCLCVLVYVIHYK